MISLRLSRYFIVVFTPSINLLYLHPFVTNFLWHSETQIHDKQLHFKLHCGTKVQFAPRVQLDTPSTSAGQKSVSVRDSTYAISYNQAHGTLVSFHQSQKHPQKSLRYQIMNSAHNTA